jgi:hypothetical protein
MEARSKLLDGTTASRRWTRKLVLLLPPLLLFLLRTESLQGLESDERFRTRENECHFYAGGQVYPGEASRVSVADHSLHLSKAKSRWCLASLGGGGRTRGILDPNCGCYKRVGLELGRTPPPRLPGSSRSTPCLCGCEVGGGFLV